MTERSADPQVVCPFVAFDDDRDYRSAVPDHRHRCFAESPAAPRALAHQAAYCMSGSFPSCPTFVDWARREAAPPKVESPVRSLRGPAGAPRRAAATAAPSADPADTVQPRGSADDWAAPPPWSGAAAGAAAAGNAGGAGAAGPAGAWGGDAALADAGAVPAADDLLADDVPATAPPGGSDVRAAAPEPPDDTPAFLAGRAGRVPTPPQAWPDDELLDDADELPPDERYVEPPARRPAVEPRRAPVGYAPVAPNADDRRAGGSRRERNDPAAPSWEQPRRLEAYPTLKSRGARGIPRPAIYALIVLVVGLGLFAAPLLLRGLGGGGAQASPTPAASGSGLPSTQPSATPKPTPAQVVYTVKANDTLSKIAAKYNVTVDQILAANANIKNPNQIAVGDKIIIPQALPSEIVNGEITPVP